MEILREVYDKSNELLTNLILEARNADLSSLDGRMNLMNKSSAYCRYINSIDTPELLNQLDNRLSWLENRNLAMNLIGRYNHYVSKIEALGNAVIDACLSSSFTVTERFLTKLENLDSKYK